MGRNGFHMGSTSDIAYGAVLIGVIALASSIIGWVMPFTPSPSCNGTFFSSWGRCEEGSTSCSMQGGIICSPNDIVYSPSFTNPVTRSDISLTLQRLSGGSQTLTIPQSYTTWSFLHIQSSGQIWTNMPVAQTEFFGDALGQHRLTVDWGNMTSLDFIIVCSVASASGTAILDVQYSLDTGVTWTTIPGITINISASFCGLGIPLDWGIEGGVCSPPTLTTACYQPIPAPARIEGVLLRIIGTNGNGVGDVPTFQQAYIITHTSSSSQTLSFVCNAGADPSSLGPRNSFKITIDCSIASSQTITVGWKVYMPNG